MKIFFFVGEVSDVTQEIRQFLESKGVICIDAENPLEIVQTGLQQKFAVTFFSDPQHAYFFLKAYQFPEMHLLHVLYLPAGTRLDPDLVERFKQFKVHVFTPEAKVELIQLLNGFIKNNQSNTEFARKMQTLVDELIKRRG